ncbi:MAG: YbaY family lipoprotein [Blastocatellia bacterium]
MKNGNDQALVTGEIFVDKQADSFSGATVHVRLEDTSYSDAPSKAAAQQTIRNVSHKKGSETRLEFALRGKRPDEKASCFVSAHVDVNNDGEVSVGDYITMESYPVLTSGYPDHVRVRVQEVT